MGQRQPLPIRGNRRWSLKEKTKCGDTDGNPSDDVVDGKEVVEVSIEGDLSITRSKSGFNAAHVALSVSNTLDDRSAYLDLRVVLI